jgi:predicted dehydrogenase
MSDRRVNGLICSLLVAASTCGAIENQPFDGPWANPPPLPKPTGAVVQVATEVQLLQAVRQLRSNTTILIAKGVYNLSNTLHIRGNVQNVALRGATGRRDDVVLRGRGMRNRDYDDVPHGIMVSDAQDVTIADLSVGDVWFHPITLQGQSGCKRVLIHNCRLFEAGEQFLKSNPASPDGAQGGVDDGIVEYCIFEYADTARHWYTEGVDVHGGSRWVVRRNLFRNIRGPSGPKMWVAPSTSGTAHVIRSWNRT